MSGLSNLLDGAVFQNREAPGETTFGFPKYNFQHTETEKRLRYKKVIWACRRVSLLKKYQIATSVGCPFEV